MPRATIGFAARRLTNRERAGPSGAADGEEPRERVAQRKADRDRGWQARTGPVELRMPPLRTASDVPRLLEPRRVAETGAITAMIQKANIQGVSTGAVDDLVPTMTRTGLSDSQAAGRSRFDALKMR